jgi:hypothetical protein
MPTKRSHVLFYELRGCVDNNNVMQLGHQVLNLGTMRLGDKIS